MNYYNDNDPKMAAWLRELIKQNLIPPGDVDERSIEDVTGADLKGYTQCHFFAGIGGWSEALRLAGWPADRPVRKIRDGLRRWKTMGVEVKCPYCGENVPVEFSYKDSGVLKATYCSYSYTFGTRGCGKPFVYRINVKLEAQVGKIYDISNCVANEQSVLEEGEG